MAHRRCHNAFCLNCYPNNDHKQVEASMVLQPIHKDDLEVIGDELAERNEEQIFNSKLAAESDAQVEKEEHVAKYSPTSEGKSLREAETKLLGEPVIQLSETAVIKEPKAVIKWTNPEIARQEAKDVEAMMAEVFDPEVDKDILEGKFEEILPEEDSFQIALFKKDGEYGWVEFAGIFESLERVVLYSNKDDRELVVAEAGKEFDDGQGLDFFIVDVATEPSEVLFGVRLIQMNAFA